MGLGPNDRPPKKPKSTGFLLDTFLSGKSATGWGLQDKGVVGSHKEKAVNKDRKIRTAHTAEMKTKPRLDHSC